ncbi:MAG: hypothetical protein AB7J13_02045 [Pyrinomonadaceae bacterium]
MVSSNKNYELAFTEHPEYLYAELRGETISADIVREYVDELVAKCEETGISRILLYRDIPVVLSGGQVFFTVTKGVDPLRGIKVALVNPYKELAEMLKFGMTVGQNRGADYSYFDNVAEATKWLLQDG